MTVTISTNHNQRLDHVAHTELQRYKQSKQLSANQCKPVNNNHTTQHTQCRPDQPQPQHSPASFTC